MTAWSSAASRRRRSAGGIIIPDTAKEKPQEGEVVAVGPGARNEKGKLVPLDVKAGDRVLFGKWSGTEVKIDGEELLIMKESDIMGVIEGASEKSRRARGLITERRKNENGSQGRQILVPTRATGCCAASTSSPTR